MRKFNTAQKIRALAAVILLSFAVAGCGGGGGGGGSTAGVSGPQISLPAPTGQYQAIKFTLTTDKQVYTVGEQVNATLTATNTSSETLSYGEIIGGGERLLVQQGSTEVWDETLHPTGGLGGYQQTSLAPGQSVTYPVMVWNQTTDGGNVSEQGVALPQVPPGQYSLRGYTVDAFYEAPTGSGATWYETNFAAPLVTITVQ